MDAYNLNISKLNYTTDSISIDKFSLSVAGKVLFQDSPLTISPGNIYGLIGKNGVGKSSLLKQLGLTSIFSENKIRVLYVKQELEMDNSPPAEFIFKSNVNLCALMKESEEIETQLENYEEDSENDFDKLNQKYNQIQDQIRGFNKEAEFGKIKSILKGLGFTNHTVEQSCLLFSGGWRMRISLARALYLKPDLLLLDEPTNHLDLEAIIWLSSYMSDWDKIAIIVSHNIGFLNDVCSYILNIEHQKIVSYKGNYALFKLAQKQKLKEEEKAYDSYEKKLKEFRKKNARNAIDDYIKKNEVNKPERPYEVSINFISPPQFKSHIIKLDNVSFSYGSNRILDSVNIGINMQTRATLVGPNGSGKSTFMKLIMNEIKEDNGNIWKQTNLRVGYYNQHFEDLLPNELTPIEYLKNLVPQSLIESDREKTVRSYLGKVKLEGTAHNKLIKELSGGQKARVAFVNLIFHEPHLLLLDEPTNHLDIETVEGLIEGLKDFDGAIVLITHEPELINALESDLWIMNPEKKTIEISKNTYEEYSQIVLNKILKN
jgi:ATP-binding cassette subfamily F protein 1